MRQSKKPKKMMREITKNNKSLKSKSKELSTSLHIANHKSMELSRKLDKVNKELNDLKSIRSKPNFNNMEKRQIEVSLEFKTDSHLCLSKGISMMDISSIMRDKSMTDSFIEYNSCIFAEELLEPIMKEAEAIVKKNLIDIVESIRKRGYGW